MPAFVAKRICQFVATASEASYYTTPASTATILKQCIVANTTAVPQSLGLSVVPSGNAAGNANRIIPNTMIPGNSSVVLDITTVLATGDFISAIASAANSLTVTISGMESPGSNGASTGSTVATPVSWGSPVATGNANADGVATTLARSDHVHSLGSTTPSVRVRMTTTQGVTSGVWTAVTFQVTDHDTHTFWSAGAPSRLTVPTGQGGLYLIEGAVCFTASTVGARGSGLRKNGTGTGGPTFGHWIGHPNQVGWGNGVIAPPAIARLVAGDWIELLALHNIGATHNIYAEDGNPHLAMAKIGV